MEIDLVAIPPAAGGLAIHALDKYGKGRLPARLNRGDRFAHACARHLNVALLFKGADFAVTDITRA